MSLFDKPISYEQNVMMKYDRNLTSDEKYIQEKEKILNKNIENENLNESNYDIKKQVYNPIFVTDPIIQHEIDTDESYNI